MDTFDDFRNFEKEALLEIVFMISEEWETPG